MNLRNLQTCLVVAGLYKCTVCTAVQQARVQAMGWNYVDNVRAELCREVNTDGWAGTVCPGERIRHKKWV